MTLIFYFSVLISGRYTNFRFSVLFSFGSIFLYQKWGCFISVCQYRINTWLTNFIIHPATRKYWSACNLCVLTEVMKWMLKDMGFQSYPQTNCLCNWRACFLKLFFFFLIYLLMSQRGYDLPQLKHSFCVYIEAYVQHVKMVWRRVTWSWGRDPQALPAACCVPVMNLCTTVQWAALPHRTPFIWAKS